MKTLNLKIKNWKNYRVWIIGASSGIGLSLSQELIKRGAFTFVTSRSIEPMLRLKEKHPKQVEVLTADVTDDGKLQKVFENITQYHGGLDMVIYLAAKYRPMKLTQLDIEYSKKIVDVNLIGFLNVLSLVIPNFIKKQCGKIVVVSSVAGYRGLPNSLVYGATKAALINLAETMYSELRDSGIGVHLVNPGFVNTRLTSKNSFDMPMIIQPNEAAKKIISGLENGAFEIHFPKLFTIFVKFLRIVPYRIYFKVVGLLGKV